MTAQSDTTLSGLTKQERLVRIHNRINTDLPFFTSNCLRVTSKEGEIVPLILNRAQMYVHLLIEEQKAKFGRVRAYILKGRQQGVSTYVGARFYQQTSRGHGKSTFIISHDADSTNNLFSMVSKYHGCLPESARPAVGVSNVHRLEFSERAGSYAVGTAGNAQVGRSRTIQYLHGSEVAFWPNTDKIQAGAMQAVGDVNGTEILFESTANGMSNMFYHGCMDALKGKGDFILIFVPWFWQDEYMRVPDEDFIPDAEEEKYIELHMSEFPREEAIQKICWRRFKRITLQSESRFKQEYPATPIEAFQSSGDALISAEDIMMARKSTVTDRVAPLVLGVDAARKGDRTIIVPRRGREMLNYLKYEEMDEMRLAGILAGMLENNHEIEQAFIDPGVAYGTYDRLCELGFGRKVTLVNFGGKSYDPLQYLNKRAEMLIAVRDWLHGGGVSIPDDDEIQADLSAVPDYKENSKRQKQIESKDKIRAACGFSPDIFDALALTFAYPVSSSPIADKLKQRRIMGIGTKGPLTSLKRKRKKGGEGGRSSVSTLQRKRRTG